MHRILVPLADGTEEMEAVIMVDTLRRAKLEVVTAAVGTTRTITASRNMILVADALWSEIDPDDFDVILLPGGAGGTAKLAGHPPLLEVLRTFNRAGSLIGAICAGPLVLQAAGILPGRRVTCHPGVASELTATARLGARVVEDANLITSQGPGSSFEFALAVITRLLGHDAAAAVATGLILP